MKGMNWLVRSVFPVAFVLVGGASAGEVDEVAPVEQAEACTQDFLEVDLPLTPECGVICCFVACHEYGCFCMNCQPMPGTECPAGRIPIEDCPDGGGGGGTHTQDGTLLLFSNGKLIVRTVGHDSSDDVEDSVEAEVSEELEVVGEAFLVNDDGHYYLTRDTSDVPAGALIVKLGASRSRQGADVQAEKVFELNGQLTLQVLSEEGHAYLWATDKAGGTSFEVTFTIPGDASTAGGFVWRPCCGAWCPPHGHCFRCCGLGILQHAECWCDDDGAHCICVPNEGLGTDSIEVDLEATGAQGVDDAIGIDELPHGGG